MEYDKIAEAYIRLTEEALMESRIDFVKKQYDGKLDTEHDHYGEIKHSDGIIDHFAQNADPSAKKVHTAWIVGQYAKKNVRQEDAPNIRENLVNFDKYRPLLPEKDLAKYATIGDVGRAVQPHIGAPVSNKEKDTIVNDAGHELKYQDDKIKIFHVKTKEASQNIYGGGSTRGGTGTNWCTAARSSDCRFDRYAQDGKHHVVHDKDTGKVYQYHVNLNQFMQADNSPIDTATFVKLAPNIHAAWEKHPELLG